MSGTVLLLKFGGFFSCIPGYYLSEKLIFSSSGTGPIFPLIENWHLRMITAYVFHGFVRFLLDLSVPSCPMTAF